MRLPSSLNRPGKLLLGGGLLASAAALTALVIETRKPESQLLGRTLVAGHDPDEIALTYDDGPNDRSTPELLAVLDRLGVKATFFVIGKFVQQRPDLVRAVRSAGHLVGNHTVTHPHLAYLLARRIREELTGCNHLLEDALGEPVSFFRPPYGARRPAVLRIARELGLTTVQWNVQGNDWEPVGPQAILARIAGGLTRAERQSRGANILLHDGFDEQPGYDRTPTVQATAQLISVAQASSKRFVTVDAWV